MATKSAQKGSDSGPDLSTPGAVSKALKAVTADTDQATAKKIKSAAARHKVDIPDNHPVHKAAGSGGGDSSSDDKGPAKGKIPPAFLKHIKHAEGDAPPQKPPAKGQQGGQQQGQQPQQGGDQQAAGAAQGDGGTGKGYTPHPYEVGPDETVKCPGCGRMNAEDAAYCDQCGLHLAGANDVKVAAGELDSGPGSKKRSDISKGDFAFVDSDGNGHLPVHDQSHVSNALSRFGQTQFPDSQTKAKAARKIMSRAKKHGIDVDDGSAVAKAAKMAEPLLFAGPVMPADFKEGNPIPFLRVGEHTFANDYGDVHISEADLDKVVENWKNGVRRQDIAIVNEEHAVAQYNDDGDILVGPGAIGYMKDLYRDGDTVFMVPEYNRAGESLIKQDRYRGVSPELLLHWTDPETLEDHGLTAVGAAFTNKPRMKALASRGQPLDPEAAMAASEGRVLAFAEQPVKFAGLAPQDVHIDKAMEGMSVDYAFPDRQRLPLGSEWSIKGSKARFLTVDAEEEERDQAWERLKQAAQQHGVDVPDSWRMLKASECAQILMAEGDDTDEDKAEGMQEPCAHQPPYAVHKPMVYGMSGAHHPCPGYTRADPDNDGDADCCALASRGCNGYMPLSLVQTQDARLEQAASDVASDIATATGGASPGPMESMGYSESQEIAMPEENDNPQAVEAAETEEVEGTAAAAPPEEASRVPADFAEMQNMYLAERQARLEQNRRLQLAEQQARQATEQIERMRSAEQLKSVNDRMEALVRTGRITPAARETWSQDLARFAEDDFFLQGLEALPEGHAVDMSEKGSGNADEGLTGTAKLDMQAKKLMESRGQPTNPRSKGFSENYKLALAEVTQVGYQPG